MTRRIEKSIVVNVPINAAYHQWTSFEEFPRFMEGVKEVRQTDPKHLHWVAEIGNKTKEWDAEIVSERNNEVVSWRSTSGAPNQGTVRFHPVSATESEVELVVDYAPEGAAENLASWFGVVSARVERDLRRFKEFVEGRHEVSSGRRTEGGRPERRGAGPTGGGGFGTTRGGTAPGEPERETAPYMPASAEPGGVGTPRRMERMGRPETGMGGTMEPSRGAARGAGREAHPGTEKERSGRERGERR